jgi:predicted O-methyltransferase YrrM
MSFIRNLVINLNSVLNQRRWLGKELAHIDRTSHSAAAPLARALRAVLAGGFSEAERERFRRIESLRRSLLADGRGLEILDLRAGARQPPPRRLPGGRMLHTTVARSALSSKSPFWARVLFKVVRETRPQRVLELGTNLGISAAYLASALRVNEEGSLVTLEGAAARADLARRHLERLGLDNATVITGRFQDTLPGVLANCAPVDFAFIDGHHDEDATKEYFAQVTGHTSTAALVVLDDIRWSRGMQRAWNEIRVDPRVAFAVDLRVLGICVVRGPVVLQ